MDIQLHGRNIGRLKYDSARAIRMSRGFDIVATTFPFELELLPQSDGPAWLIDSISVQVYGRVPGQPDMILASGRYLQILSSAQSGMEVPIELDCRCTPRAMSEYERARNGAVVALRFAFSLHLYFSRQSTGRPGGQGEPVYIHVHEEVSFDKAIWTSALRSVGLSASLLIEIPFPIDGEPIDDGLLALSHAYASFQNGGSTAWKNTVVHIRPFLEKWRETEPSSGTKLRDGSSEDRREKLLTFRDALYQCCHYWVHKDADSCTRDDALFVLSSFASLLRAAS